MSISNQDVFESQIMQDLLVFVDRAAKSQVPVLFLGPSGSGKEVLATRLHRLSPRANHPFVAINCGALHEELLLSELFGHEEGSFTGAHASKRGLVEEAHLGTLFLDEIGELPLTVQAQILRFLQSGDFYRVGSTEASHVDVRVVAATNRNLEEAVEQGRFREDLFYRLSTVTLQVPSLSERPEDCAALIRMFLNDRSIGGRVVHDVDPEVMTALLDYSWPGNIRQLKNVIERAKVLSNDVVLHVSDLPREMTHPVRHSSNFAMPPPHLPLEEVERMHILNALRHNDGNKTKTARTLGITIKTLYNKLARWSSEGDARIDDTDSTLRDRQ